jgi:hypothetical protein
MLSYVHYNPHDSTIAMKVGKEWTAEREEREWL